MRLYVSCLSFALVTALLVPISASAQTDAECVAVYDSDGTRVARAGAGSSAEGRDLNETRIFLANSGLVALLAVGRDSLEGKAFLYFASADCTGNAYIRRNTIQPGAYLVGTDVWFADTAAPVSEFVSHSRRFADTGECQTISENFSAVAPTLNFTLPTFTPPFHLEPEACFTPDPSVAALTPYSLGAMAVVFAFSAYLMVRRPRVA